MIFDTNIWKTNLYLKSSASAAVKFFLQRHRAKVGLPEVIRLEIERHLRLDIRAMRDRIALEHNRLLGLFDTLREVILPTNAEIETLVGSFFSQSGFDLLEVPFSEESARGSFLRTVDKTPPSHKTQQFKDGVLWEDCKQLAETEDVILVTDDRAFYEGEDVRKGLSVVLAKEATQCPNPLRVLAGLPDLLREIATPVTIPDSVLQNAVMTAFKEHMDQLLAHSGFAHGSKWRIEKTLYATEHPGRLYVDFAAEVDCEDVIDDGRTGAVLGIEGDGRYDVNGETLSAMQLRELSVSYFKPDGTQEQRRSMFASAHVVIGHRPVTNFVRERLDMPP